MSVYDNKWSEIYDFTPKATSPTPDLQQFNFAQTEWGGGWCGPYMFLPGHPCLFFFFITREPRVEWHKRPCAFDTSPPQNCFTSLQSSCS